MFYIYFPLQIDDGCLVKFLEKKGSNLTSLILRMEFLDGEAKKVLEAVTANCLNLVKFHWKDYDDDEIDFSSVAKLGLLKELDIRCDIECLPDAAFVRIVSKCIHLEKVGFQDF